MPSEADLDATFLPVPSCAEITIGGAYRYARDKLARAAGISPSLTQQDLWAQSGREARYILAHILDCDSHKLMLTFNLELKKAEAESLCRIIERRLSGEPLAYILGIKEFYGRDFVVSPSVLIPRCDSEALIETVLVQAALGDEGAGPSKTSGIKVLDIGTGSGCLIQTLLLERPEWSGVALDISPSALEIAARNRARHGLEDRLTLHCSDWFASLPKNMSAFDIIMSNPPYIEKSVLSTLDKGVVDFEPILALDGGDDGLMAYRILVKESISHLVEGGLLAFEIGYDQKNAVMGLMNQNGFKNTRCLSDVSGRDRVVMGLRP